MLKLLIKTLGNSFYQQHIGLFLVVFYLLFGAVEGSQLVSYHLAILMAICSSPLILSLLFGVWILYAIKSYLFIAKKLKSEDYQFAKNITSLTKKEQLSLWFKIYAYLLLPILIYACLIIVIALKHGFYFTLTATTIGLCLLLFVLSFQTFRFTNYTFKQSKGWIIWPNLKVHQPFWAWPIFYLFQEQKLMLLVVKIVSITFFKAILLLFADVGNDLRVYLTAMLAVVLSHAILIFNLIKFDATYLSFSSTLPISSLKKLSYWMAILFLLLIPEFGLLTWFTKFDIIFLANGLLFCIGTMLFLFVLVYLLKTNMENYMKCLLFFFFASMMAILTHYYLWFSIACIISSILIYLWRYPKIDLKEIA